MRGYGHVAELFDCITSGGQSVSPVVYLWNTGGKNCGD